jgi:hypothetical protein
MPEAIGPGKDAYFVMSAPALQAPTIAGQGRLTPQGHAASAIMRPMSVPARIPGKRWLTIIVGLYGLLWISLEGALWQVILLSAGLTVLGALYLVQRLLGGRLVPAGRWLLLCAGLLGVVGLSCALLALALMAVKTGLHGHGPEFTRSEIEWLVRQIPLWGTAGILAGTGLGLISLASQHR